MKTHRSVDINLQHWRDFEFWLFTTMMSNYSIRCHQCFDISPCLDIEFWSPNTKTIVASLIGSIPSFLTWMTVTALFLYRGPFSKFQEQLNETLYTIQKCFIFFLSSSILFRFQDLFVFSKSVPWRHTTPTYRFSHFYFCSFSKGEKYWLSRGSEDLELNSKVFR